MSRRVALPMYEAPAASRETFWRGLRAHLQQVGFDPEPTLFTPTDLSAHWLDPNLLLSQTCGYPLTSELDRRVSYVATPRYRAPGCAGPYYSSALVVRADDPAADIGALRGRRVAFNSRDSQSGYNSLRALVAPLAVTGRFFAETIETGAHRRSVEAVRAGRADVAAVDAVTWALLQRDEPGQTAGLRVLGYTAQAPGLPFITAGNADADRLGRLRTALAAACADPALAAARAALLFDGCDVLPIGAYDVVPAMRRAAERAGYPDLA